jgi:hypothetical protein
MTHGLPLAQKFPISGRLFSGMIQYAFGNWKLTDVKLRLV